MTLTREEVLRMAGEAGFSFKAGTGDQDMHFVSFGEVINLVNAIYQLGIAEGERREKERARGSE